VKQTKPGKTVASKGVNMEAWRREYRQLPGAKGTVEKVAGRISVHISIGQVGPGGTKKQKGRLPAKNVGAEAAASLKVTGANPGEETPSGSQKRRKR